MSYTIQTSLKGMMQIDLSIAFELSKHNGQAIKFHTQVFNRIDKLLISWFEKHSNVKTVVLPRKTFKYITTIKGVEYQSSSLRSVIDLVSKINPDNHDDISTTTRNF